MAIQYARVERVSKSKGGNACHKGAYNARAKIKDQQTNIVYNFQNRRDNIYHEILLPEYADQKFKDLKLLMNEIEKNETRKNSQLLKEFVLALPDDENISLSIKIEQIYEFIKENNFIENGLALQIDIHKPHGNNNKNWHAHLLVTTRRFTKDGTQLGEKARDLEPQIRGGRANAYVKSHEEVNIGELWKIVQNRVFARHGLENRVDIISTVPQKHIGPVRMRSLINQAVKQNELRQIAHLENIKDGDGVLNRITKTNAIFTKKDIERAVKEVESSDTKLALINQAMSSKRLVPLYNGEQRLLEQEARYYTTIEVREEELTLLRIADKVNSQSNCMDVNYLSKDIARLAKVSRAGKGALSAILLGHQGVRVLRGRAGVGKSHILGIAYRLATNYEQNIIGLAPTLKAKSGLQAVGYKECHTIKSFLFKLYNGKVRLAKNSLLVIDEAGMVGTSDYLELMKVANRRCCNIILAGDEKQLTSIERGGMFEVFAEKFGSYTLMEIKRQSKEWGRKMALCFANDDIKQGVALLEEHGSLKAHNSLEESMIGLVNDFNNSPFALKERLAITLRNREVDALNQGIREVLKASKALQGKEYRVTSLSEQGEEISSNYMAGERILFTASKKEFAVENGDFATLLFVSQDKFVALIDNKKEVNFNPGEINFRHGYATTVYKAQGASIKDVYVLHNKAGNSRNTYVELTRHIEEVSFYYNLQSTKTKSDLITELSSIDNKCASLNFLTKGDLVGLKKEEDQTLLAKANYWFKSLGTDVVDSLQRNRGYYKFETKLQPITRVEEIIVNTDVTRQTTFCHPEQSEEPLKSQEVFRLKPQNDTSDLIFKIYKSRIDDIKKIAPKYDFAFLKNNSKILGNNAFVELLESELLNVFSNYVTQHLTKFAKAKEAAKSIVEIINVLTKEQEFCSNICNNYPKLLLQFELQENNDHITRMKVIYDNKPNLLDKLKRDAGNIDSLNIWTNKAPLAEIKEVETISYIANKLANICQQYLLKDVDNDLKYLEEQGYINKDTMVFKDKESYLEYRLLDQVLNPYLQEKYNLKSDQSFNHNIPSALTNTADKSLKQITTKLTNIMHEMNITNESILTRAIDHYLEYKTFNANKVKTKKQLINIVSRAKFEEENYPKWQFYVRYNTELSNEYPSVNNSKNNILATLAIDLAAKRLSKVHSYLKCSKGLDNNKALEMAREYYQAGRDRKIAATLANHQQVIKLASVSKSAANYLAAAIVDYEANYDQDMLNPNRLEIMNHIAMHQVQLGNDLPLKLVKNNNVTEGDSDLTIKLRSSLNHQAIEFANNKLSHDMTHTILLSNNSNNQLINSDSHDIYQHNLKQHRNNTIKFTTNLLQQEYHHHLEQEKIAHQPVYLAIK